MKLLRKIGLSFMLIGLVVSLVALALGATPNASIIPSGETFVEEYKDVTSLDIKINAGMVDIVSGDTFRITVNNYPKDSIVTRLETDSETGKNRWVIEEKNGFRLQVGIQFHGPGQSMTIELPKDFVANDLNIEMGAGSMTADILKAKKTNISIGAGSFIAQNLISENSKMECGAGNIKIDGSLTGDNVIECGMGNIDFNLIGDPDDYKCSADVGLGEIVYNGNNWGGIANSINLGPANAPNKFSLECGMGKINLRIGSERGTQNESEKTF